MKTNLSSDGFSLTGAITLIAVLVAIGAAGAYVWHSKQDTKPATKTTAATPSTNPSDAKTPPGWSTYESKELGLKFAYPKTWALSDIKAIETASGEKGWTISVQSSSPSNGDPNVTLSTYPSNATINDVDAGPNDVKVQDLITTDKTTFTLVGTIEDLGKVTKPSQMYDSSCWPRNCTPKLMNGRFLGIDIGSTNNDCTKGSICPTEINTNGENYSNLLAILKSITAIQ